MDLLRARWDENKFVCVGLDSDFDKIPESVKKDRRGDYIETVVDFNVRIVDATRDLVCAYKPNTAFYEQHGREGVQALRHTIENIHLLAPKVPVILDAKRADIGNTNIGYAKAAFDFLKADAITVHPYLGAEALQPFLDRADKGVIVLCRTSNSGASEFQDVTLTVSSPEYEEMDEDELLPTEAMPAELRLFHYVAYRTTRFWNKNGNCALVVGATYPGELREVRGLIGDMPILIPGVGAQGGDVEKTVSAGKNSGGQGMIVNASRSIIFASQGENFAEVAREETEKLHNQINQYR